MTRRRTATDPKRAVAYLRASTDRQDLSPDAQAAAIEAWANREGGLLGAIESVKATGAGILVVARRDRLARDVLVAAMVERLVEREGGRILTADGAGNADGPEGQLLRGVMDLFAQFERAIIRARTRAALAVKKARGERTGGIPLGSRLEGGRLVGDDAERAAVTRARALRGAGKSLREIAAALEAEGHRPRGRRWHVETLSRIVASA
jgi:DNA invertase Pin-like site-specific DNA recombinase